VTYLVAPPIHPTLSAVDKRSAQMPRLVRKIAIALLILGFARAAVAQTAVKITEILRSPANYNEHEVAVFGRVEGLTVGEQYATFRICANRCLNVLAWDHPRISEGQALNVRGRFHLVKHLDHHRLHHVIEVEHGAL
jgi:hypothetical protein